MSYRDEYQFWLEDAYFDAETKAELKAIADDVCGHVAEDGIYHYCIQHGLI